MFLLQLQGLGKTLFYTIIAKARSIWNKQYWFSSWILLSHKFHIYLGVINDANIQKNKEKNLVLLAPSFFLALYFINIKIPS